LISSRGDVIQSPSIGVQDRIKESNGFLAKGKASIVKQRDDSAYSWGRCRRPEDAVELSPNGDEIVGTVRTDVWVAPSGHGIIVLRRVVGGLVILEVFGNSALLVFRYGEHIAKATSAVDDLLASTLWVMYCRAGIDLSGADRCNPRTG